MKRLLALFYSHRRDSGACCERGFSLIEMIGVLAVMSVLSAAIVPNIIKQIDSATADTETKNLAAISNSLKFYITSNLAIPSSSELLSAISKVSSLSTTEILQNRHGFERAYFVDPHFFTSVNQSFSGYKQTTGLYTMPVSPRVMILSNLKGTLPPAPKTFAEFDAIWNQTAKAKIQESSTLKIQRVFLGDIFHECILSNHGVQTPSYSLGNGVKVALPIAAAGSDGIKHVFVIQGTELKLFHSPFPSGSVQSSSFIQGKASFIYDTDGSSWFWRK